MKKQLLCSAMGLGLALATPAARAGDNDNYGEVRWGSLPLVGQISKSIWVGSWWGYTRDGIAYRHRGPNAGSSYDSVWTRWDNKDTSALSAAEKFDKLKGRADKIEYAKLVEKGKKFGDLKGAMQAKIDEQRTLVRKINRAISDSGEANFAWWDTTDGKRYTALQDEVKTLSTDVDAITLTIDTATEYELFSHGSMQFGVGSWFGHCNAWSAAAIMEPEPRHEVTVDGITFTAGEVKALLTETWMEINSSFYGTRNEDHETEEGRKDVSYRDITPSAFHILFADQIGKRDKSFVIDRFTGSEVWNQPVVAYRSKAEALYTGTTGLDREVVYTEYSGARATEQKRGTKKVFPVLVTTTMHWVTDGLPHEALTVTLNPDIDDETFADHSAIREMYDDQIELRTLTYELWLDKPMTDPTAKIIGDGAWQHGSGSEYEHLQPDFAWQPLANVNNSRDYENELVDYKFLKEKILPGSITPAQNPTTPSTSFSFSGAAVAIPDNATAGASATVAVSAAVSITTLTVDVDITHTYIGDLKVTLTGPTGKVAVLKDFGEGGSTKDLKKTYDVKAFNNTAAAGTWTLQVVDNAAQDDGTINGVKLSVK